MLAKREPKAQTGRRSVWLEPPTIAVVRRLQRIKWHHSAPISTVVLTQGVVLGLPKPPKDRTDRALALALSAARGSRVVFLSLMSTPKTAPRFFAFIPKLSCA
jgi:hypothetical protein